MLMTDSMSTANDLGAGWNKLYYDVSADRSQFLRSRTNYFRGGSRYCGGAAIIISDTKSRSTCTANAA